MDSVNNDKKYKLHQHLHFQIHLEKKKTNEKLDDRMTFR